MEISRIRILNQALFYRIIKKCLVNKTNVLLILFVIATILWARLVPHSPNFSPLASILLFAGVYVKNKKHLIWPLLALLISDFFIGFYAWPIMLSVYGSFALIALLGRWLQNKKNTLNVLSSAMGSALIFFLITNFAVWAFGTWYSHDLAGLSLAYTLAIPFFKNTLISNLLYSSLLFAAYESLRYFIRQKALAYNK